jgi:hypothetical protein
LLLNHFAFTNIRLCCLFVGEKLVAEIVDRLKSVLPSNRGEYDVSSPQMSHAELADFHLKSLRKKMPTFAPPMSEGLPICATEKLAALKADRKAAAENRSEKVSSAIKLSMFSSVVTTRFWGRAVMGVCLLFRALRLLHEVP